MSEKVKSEKKKRFGPVKTSIMIVSAALVAAVGTWACIAFLRPQQRNDVAEDYGSSMIEVQPGERFDPAAYVPLKERDENDVAVSDEDGTYDAVDIYARINYTFGQQQNWYSEMHSEVQTAVGIQNVETYKRYADPILISSDITTSSLVNVAREYCYVGDRVIWRNSSGGKDSWDGMNTSFSEGEPVGNMNIDGEDGFKKKNGLPATELSVYVIRGSTVESAELTEGSNAALADGEKLYTVTYHLKAKTDETGATGAAAYYGNQMVFTGGIDAPPTFNYITVSYTFTEDWLPVSCTVDESYTATMKTIVSSCTSHSVTEFSYGIEEIEGEVEEIYESYYKQYADSAATGEGEKQLTATDCLAEAFSPVLTGPSVLDLSLEIGGKELDGSVYLDLGNALSGSLGGLDVRLDLKDLLGFWVQDGTAYVKYGGLKLSMTLEELTALIPSGGTEGEIDTDALLSGLMDGEFTYDDRRADLNSTLSLGDAEAKIGFHFLLDENKSASLDYVEAEFAVNGTEITLHASFGEEGPAPLSEAEKTQFAQLGTHAAMLKEMIEGGYLRLGVSYAGDGFALDGKVDLSISPLMLKGSFTLSAGEREKEIGIAFDGEIVCLDIDGLKIGTTTEELLPLLSGVLPAAETDSFDLGGLLNTLLDGSFAQNFTSSEAENVLQLTLKGTQILRALGVEFELGDLSLSLGEDGCTLSALGATLTLSKGSSFDVETEGYTEVLPYVMGVYELIQGGKLDIALSYKNTEAGIELSGNILLGTEPVVAVANLTLTYGNATKELTVTYKENTVYVLVDGIKVKANITEIANLLGMAGEETGNLEVGEILGTVLGLDFGTIIPVLKNGTNTLEIQLAVDELLNGLGVDLTLGTVNVEIGEGILVTAEGLEVTISAAEEAPAGGELTGYIELAPVVETVVGLLQNNYLAAQINYTGDMTLAGEVKFDIAELKLSAELELTYNEAVKAIKVGFVNDGNIYLEIDGLKIKAGLDEIADLVGMLGTAQMAEAELTPVEKLLENLGQLVSVGAEGNGVKLTLAVDKILEAFGVSMELGQAEAVIADGKISVNALENALNVTLSKGSSFDVETEGYTEVLPYVMGIYELIQGGKIDIALSYKNTEAGIELGGNILLGTEPVVAVANLTLTYGNVTKELTVTYKENIVYVLVDGIKVKANITEIANLLGIAGEETGNLEVGEILGTVLSLDFGTIIPVLKNGTNTLEIQLAVDELLSGLGVDLSLGTVNVEIGEGILVTAEGLEVSISAAEEAPAEGDLTGYTELAPVVETVVGLLQNNYLAAQISYTGDMTLAGEVKFDIAELKLGAELELTYQKAVKAIKVGFVNDGNIYLEIDGLKVKAGLDEIADLVGMLGTAQMAEAELTPVEKLLENLGQLVSVGAEGNGVKLTLAVDQILAAFGVSMELGQAEAVIADGKISVNALENALSVTLSKGETFDVETEGYTEVLPYVMGVYELIQGGKIDIALSYKNTEAGIELSGNILLGTEPVVAVANLTLTYGNATKELTVTYKENTVYVLVDGIKVKANISEIANLLGMAGEETGNLEVGEILGTVLGLDFGTIIPVLKNGSNTLEIQLAVDELLSSLGVDLGDFALGIAKVKVRSGKIELIAAGAKLTFTEAKSAPKPAKNLSSYVDILPVLKTAVGLIQNNFISAQINYQGDISVAGNIALDLAALNVSATLTLKVAGGEKTFRFGFVHASNTVLVEVDGLKIGATTEEIGELIAAFTGGSASSLDPVETLLENLGSFVNIKNDGKAFAATVALDAVLNAFGVDLGMALGELTLSESEDSLQLSAMNGALTAKIGAGEPFEAENDGDYVEVLPYILGIRDLLQGDGLKISLSYQSGEISLDGDLTVALKAEEGMPAAAAQLTLSYGKAVKEISVLYQDSAVYLTVDGLKFTADVGEVAALLGGSTESGTESLLGGLLSIDFKTLIPALKNGNKSLEMKLALDLLVQSLGFDLGDFRLGEADVTMREGGVLLSVAGLRAEISAAEILPAKANLEGYADLMPLIKTALTLFKDNTYLTAELKGSLGEFTLAGEIKLNVDPLQIDASLTASYRGAEKAFGVSFVGDGMIYLTVDGLRFKADIAAAAELISSLTESGGNTDTAAAVEQLLQNLGAIVQTEPGDTAFKATVALDEILRAFNVGLSLGDAEVTADGTTLSVSAMQGALTLDVERGKRFTVSTFGYTEIVKYAKTLLAIFRGETVKADISYASEELGLSVKGTLNLALDTMTVYADVTVRYQNIALALKLFYLPEGTVLAEVNGLKVKGSVDTLAAFITSILGTEVGMGEINSPDLETLIKTLLDLNLDSYFTFIETSANGRSSLHIAVKGTELLKALSLGIDFDLGDLLITISEGKVDLSVLGADLTLTAGEALPAVNEGAYADIAPLLQTASSFLESRILQAEVHYTGAISVDGTVYFSFENLDALRLSALLTVTAEGQTKPVRVSYIGDGYLYLDLDGIKVKASFEDIEAFAGLFTGSGTGDLSSLPADLLGSLGELITDAKTEQGKFTATLALDRLLSILGLDLEIGNAKLSAADGEIGISALDGALHATVTAGEPFATDTRGYTEVMPYVIGLYGLFQNQYLEVGIGYQNGNLSVTGNVSIDIQQLRIVADLTVKYGAAEKLLTVVYEENAVYVILDDIKLKANVEDIAAFAQQFTESGEEELSLLGKILSLRFGDVIALFSAGENALGLQIATDELLGAFGMDLSLGTAQMTVREDGISLSVAGATLDLAKGEGAALPDLSECVDVMSAVNAVYNMVKAGYLHAEVNYKGEFTLAGNIDFDINALTVKADLTLGYGEASRRILLQYAGGTVYLMLFNDPDGSDGFKVTATAEGLKALIAIFTESGGESGTDYLEQLIADLGKIVDIGNADSLLDVDISLDELLALFGVKASLGGVRLSVGEDEIALSALNNALTATVKAGGTFETDTNGYTLSLGSVTELVRKFKEAQGISFADPTDSNASTDLTLIYNGNEIAVYLENAGISWENGFAFRGDVVFSALGYHHRISVYADTEMVQLAYGSIGATIVYADFAKIGDAFNAVKNAILSYIKDILEETPEGAKGEISSALALAEGGEALSGLVGALTEFVGGFMTEEKETKVKKFDLAKLIGGLKIENSEEEGGLLTVSYNGISVKLAAAGDTLSANLSLTLNVPAQEGEEAQNIQLIGDITLTALAKPLPAMPNISYLGTDKFINFIGYLGSAVDLLNTTNLTLTFSGKVTSTQNQYKEFGGVKYDINASMETHRGNADLFHLEIDDHNFWIDSDVYMHASIKIEAKNKAVDSSLYIDVFILDGGPSSTEANNETDFYVTLSQFDSTHEHEKYNPVKLYAPASEIMTLLSSALPMFGIDVGLLNDFMVFKWLTDMNTVEQFKAFGTLLNPLLQGLLGGESGKTPSETPETPDTPAEKPTFDLSKYLTKLTVGADGLNIVLNSEGLYGITGLAPVTATLTKYADIVGKAEDGATTYTFGRFKELNLHNIYNKEGTLNTSLDGTIKYGKAEGEENGDNLAVPSGTYRSFLGADKLLQALAKSATHVVEGKDIISGEETYHTYAVNDLFYIDGKITANAQLFGLDISSIGVNVDIVAISITVDKQGKIGINIRLEYQSSNIGAFVAINGDGEVDITIKDDMVYIKRVQKSYYEIIKIPVVGTPIDARKHTYTNPNDYITLYRAMPLDNFMSDMLNQLGFILNFGDQLMDQIKKNSGSGSSEPEQVVDFGQRLDDVLSKYTYTPEEKDENGNVTTPASWDLTLNGDALVKGILGEINIKLCEDVDGYFHNIDADLKIVSIISAKLSLRWRNPGGTMEDGIKDQTNDLTEEVGGETHGMGAMINELNKTVKTIDETTINGWQDDPTTADVEGTIYLEAKPFTVTYTYMPARGGDKVSFDELKATYLVGSSDNKLYSEEIPTKNISAYNTWEYTYTCEQTAYTFGNVLSGSGIEYNVMETINQYTVRFETTVLDGFAKDWQEENGKRYYEFDMDYGSEILVAGKTTILDKDLIEKNSEEGKILIELPDIPHSAEGIEGQWLSDYSVEEDGATFNAIFPAEVIYSSTIAFTIDGNTAAYQDDTKTYEYSTTYLSTEYPLSTPSAAGYTFLGWFVETESGWKAVTMLNSAESASTTVEALWAQENLQLQLTGERKKVSGIANYNWTLTVTEQQEVLEGAWANSDFVRTITYKVYIGENEPSNESKYTEIQGNTYNTTFQAWNRAGVKAYVIATVSYKINNSEVYTFSVKKNGTYDLGGRLS